LPFYDILQIDTSFLDDVGTKYRQKELIFVQQILILFSIEEKINIHKSFRYFDDYTGSERILFQGGNDIILNRRYDEFYTK
jgi:hypothetical protein